MDISVLYEDQDLVVINKPAGVVVNNAQSVRGETLQTWFAERYLESVAESKAESAAESKTDAGTELTTVQSDWQALVTETFDDTYGTPSEIFAERQGMVHRLDKNTSGVVVFAKNPGALVSLLAQFRERKVQKSYLCLVHGQVSPERDVVRAPLGRATGPDRKKFQVRTDGRPAETEYQVLEKWPSFSQETSIDSEIVNHPTYQQGFSLIQAWPHTGRTHQIRVHFKHLGHPLVGDDTYTGKKRAKVDRKWCRRHFLHAWQLRLTQPRSGQSIQFCAPLSQDLSKVLQQAFEFKASFDQKVETNR